ncbi:bifunctional folylpolyglutamate synthase/dihydrofolate synthase [Aquibacillus sediminis]|uniref:bifunctional folylpolyglutamate synthase/dihydrofolate synthase n=1 Tax=Aquibacillus sediminis TaxID=2574734 RepID=UPI001108D8C5|nr:folylpolyglutamate synthase/dihydrofolate synthase family protein [Aquibacillus sediminis]
MYATINEVYQFLQNRKAFGIRLGLGRMEKMLAMLDHPEQHLKAVHVAGTNGKGSTITFIKQALIANGYKVGTFTSPALHEFNEHICMDHEPIPDTSLMACVNQLLPIVEQLDLENDPPTEYEIVVMIAILYFTHNVDIALFETNMGGRDDSTNCIQPILTIITNIGLDHTRMLGETYQEIAAHKAGIIKQGIPLILGNIGGEALVVIHREAIDKNAIIYQYGQDFTVRDSQQNNAGMECFTFVGNRIELEAITISMRGKHQMVNAAVACQALMELDRQGFSLRTSVTRKGIKQAVMPGRFEQMSSCPRVIVDAAHNQEGLRAFVQAVERYFPSKQKTLIFAAFQDKPLTKMVPQLDSKLFDQVTFTSFTHQRASTAETLAQLSSHENKQVMPDWKLAILAVLHKDEQSLVFVTGSLHFIGLVKQYFENSFEL